MSGDEVGRLFRLAHPGGKVLFVTGDADPRFQFRPVPWPDEAILERAFTLVEQWGGWGSNPRPDGSHIRCSGPFYDDHPECIAAAQDA